MHSIKNIVRNCGEHLKALNLASNMVSGNGFELFLEDLVSNESLKSLDLGVLESSMRKNSLGTHGAHCLATLLRKNNVLEALSVGDNDLGPEGGQTLG